MKMTVDGKAIEIAEISIITTAPLPPAPIALGIDWGTDAPLDGAEVEGVITFSFVGALFDNVEALPPGAYEPKLGRGLLNQSSDGGTITIDTKLMPNGPVSVRLCAFQTVPGEEWAQQADSVARTWNVYNSIARPLPNEPTSDTMISTDTIDAPASLPGAPKGWKPELVEDWSAYPLGVVQQFDPARWYDAFSHGSEVLNGGKEQGIYVTPVTRARGVKYYPHSIALVDGKRALTITPRHTPPEEIKATWGYPVESGVLSCAKELIYGYYEAEVMLPQFKGAWSAMWSMGPSWWPEFDMLEHVPHAMGNGRFQIGTHTHNPTNKPSNDVARGDLISSPARVDRWFTLSGIITPKVIAGYVNGTRVWTRPNVAHSTDAAIHEPHHLLFSLAIIGKDPASWGGPVTIDAGLVFAPLCVSKVRIFSLPA